MADVTLALHLYLSPLFQGAHAARQLQLPVVSSLAVTKGGHQLEVYLMCHHLFVEHLLRSASRPPVRARRSPGRGGGPRYPHMLRSMELSYLTGDRSAQVVYRDELRPSYWGERERGGGAMSSKATAGRWGGEHVLVGWGLFSFVGSGRMEFVYVQY